MNANGSCHSPSRNGESPGRKLYEISRDQGILSELLRCKITSQTMQVNSKSGRAKHLFGMLRDQSRNHACQYVSSTAGCHAGVACGIHPDPAGCRDQSTMALQHDDHLMLARKPPRDLHSVRLYVSQTQPSQARHLTGMRSHHYAFENAVELA